MVLRSLASEHNSVHHLPTFTCYQKTYIQSKRISHIVFQSSIGRRISVISTFASILLTKESIFHKDFANAFGFDMVAPEQTIEEAESGIRGHAKSLLQVKGMLESESWGEAQKALRASSAGLKQDIYTIIQAKPASERPQFRKLYSHLFNNVTKLDYAARDRDPSRVWQLYDNMVVALNDILSRIS